MLRRATIPAWTLATLLCFTLLPGIPGPAAQTRVTYLGLRTRPGAASDWLLGQASNLLEQRLAGLPGTVLIPTEQVVRALGSPLALGSCQEDGCMALFGQTVGAHQVIWGYLDRPWPTGYRIWVRVLELPAGTLQREAQPACNPCDEAGLLGTLATHGLADLGLAPRASDPARAAAAAAAATAASQPSAILQIPGVHRPLTAEEQARAGWLTLHSDPPAATLLLFSYDVGKTPQNGLQLLPGAYQAVLRLEGFQDQTFALAIRPGQETRQLLRLVPAGILLRVVSLPLEAQVLVDGRPAGRTPLSAALLTPGAHRIQVVAEGYLPVEQTVQATPGRAVELSFALQVAPVQHGFLAVSTRPNRASVLVDEEPLGQSPIRKRELAAGEHKVSAYLPGFELAEQTVQIQPGLTAKVSLELRPARQVRTLLSVTSAPPGAKVYLGNMRIGRTPLEEIKFKPGRHVLRLMLDGYPPYETPFVMQEGELTRHHADLGQGPPIGGGLLDEVEAP